MKKEGVIAVGTLTAWVVLGITLFLCVARDSVVLYRYVVANFL